MPMTTWIPHRIMAATSPAATKRCHVKTNYMDNQMKKQHYIFGPVPSRRLGRSLGIDLIPMKTCPYDCLYCQLGRTTNKTVLRKEWVPLEAVVAELQEKLVTKPDYITLGGSGEPTLYSRIGELIERIRSITDIPVAVLTNGSLLWQKTVREALMDANLVIPSLDAGDEALFRIVNRPTTAIDFEHMLEGLIAFRQEYAGAYWLEILLLAGYSAIQSEVTKLAACVKKIKPDKVQLNTATRPPAEDYAVTVAPNRLHELAAQFDPPAEVIADYRGIQYVAEFCAGRENILQLLQRRPCTADDIGAGLGMHKNEVVKYLEELVSGGRLEPYRIQGNVYYRPMAVPAQTAGIG